MESRSKIKKLLHSNYEDEKRHLSYVVDQLKKLDNV